jgi:hypothetical protein
LMEKSSGNATAVAPAVLPPVFCPFVIHERIDEEALAPNPSATEPRSPRNG